MPKPKHPALIQIRCSEAWKERLRAYAERTERDMADVVREAVRQYLDREEKRENR